VKGTPVFLVGSFQNAVGLFAVGGFLISEFAPEDERTIIAERNFEKCKPQGGGSIYVKQASIGEFTTSQGSRVVGFSCVSREQCYVATQ
jgi:hypothetical protein